ncbi:MAG: hypothetical protein IAE79_17915 [Anaerolinea sp.]|nr:hypothetical protein [Anaerolinea sp.]
MNLLFECKRVAEETKRPCVVFDGDVCPLDDAVQALQEARISEQRHRLLITYIAWPNNYAFRVKVGDVGRVLDWWQGVK